MTHLRTARLLLRPARSSDLDDLHSVYGAPEAMRYWAWETHPTPDQTQAVIAGLMAQSDPVSYLVIEMDGRAIGCCGVHERDEIGFILHPGFWRRGIMREALETYVPHAFDNLGHRRLTAETDPRNTASIALLTSLGFSETHREERTIFLYEEWCDSVFFMLDAPRR